MSISKNEQSGAKNPAIFTGEKDMAMSPMNEDERRALERLIVYVRDDCGELKDYQAMRDGGQDISLHIWRNVEPLILYLLEFKKRDCAECGDHRHLRNCERCKKKCCDGCLRFVEWIRGKPYICRECHQKAIDKN